MSFGSHGNAIRRSDPRKRKLDSQDNSNANADSSTLSATPEATLSATDSPTPEATDSSTFSFRLAKTFQEQLNLSEVLSEWIPPPFSLPTGLDSIIAAYAFEELIMPRQGVDAFLFMSDTYARQDRRSETDGVTLERPLYFQKLGHLRYHGEPRSNGMFMDESLARAWSEIDTFNQDILRIILEYDEGCHVTPRDLNKLIQAIRFYLGSSNMTQPYSGDDYNNWLSVIIPNDNMAHHQWLKRFVYDHHPILNIQLQQSRDGLALFIRDITAPSWWILIHLLQDKVRRLTHAHQINQAVDIAISTAEISFNHFFGAVYCHLLFSPLSNHFLILNIAIPQFGISSRLFLPIIWKS